MTSHGNLSYSHTSSLSHKVFTVKKYSLYMIFSFSAYFKIRHLSGQLQVLENTKKAPKF